MIITSESWSASEASHGFTLSRVTVRAWLFRSGLRPWSTKGGKQCQKVFGSEGGNG